jgi:hypothetical protein
MSDYKITFARHTGKIKDDVTEHEVSRHEFARIAGNEFVQIGVDTFQRYELSEYSATYLSIHPLRISLAG